MMKSANYLAKAVLSLLFMMSMFSGCVFDGTVDDDHYPHRYEQITGEWYVYEQYGVYDGASYDNYVPGWNMVDPDIFSDLRYDRDGNPYFNIYYSSGTRGKDECYIDRYTDEIFFYHKHEGRYDDLATGWYKLCNIEYLSNRELRLRYDVAGSYDYDIVVYRR